MQGHAMIDVGCFKELLKAGWGTKYGGELWTGVLCVYSL